MPKIDLHHHLDGAFRPSSLYKEAFRRNLPQSKLSKEDFFANCRVSSQCNSLSEFLDVFSFFIDIAARPEFLKECAFEIVEDMKNDGVIYAETRVAPHLFGGSEKISENISAILEGLQKGRQMYGLQVNLILCTMRGAPKNWVKELLEIFEIYSGKGVVGLDLAGDEGKYASEELVAYFSKAHSLKLPITIHAGEADGPKSVWNAVKKFHASRIGHGVRSIEDNELMDYLYKNKIPLEICLSSNLHTGVVKDYASHPFPHLLRKGLCVTLNTDDPSVSGIDLSNEWQKAIEHFNLTKKEIKTILLHSVSAAFLPLSKKRFLEKKVSDFFL